MQLKIKNSLKLEELSMLALGIFLFELTGYSWWVFPVLFFVPDISFAGYYFGNGPGAIVYNIFHHKGIAIFLFFCGFLFGSEVVKLAGIIIFSHSSFDRVLGFGLKYRKGFKYTHLGEIGKKSSSNNYGY